MLLVASVLSSCKRDLRLGEQEVELSVPLVSTSVSLENFIAPENYNTNENGEVNLIYEVHLYNNRPIESLTVPNRKDYHSVSLETISLSNTAIESSVTLGEAYSPAIFLHGQRFEIDTITLFRPATIPVDANTFFESADLESGSMIMTVENGFPIDIESMLFRLTNSSDNSLVGEMEFTDIASGETQSKTLDMGGVYAEGSMLGELLRVKTKKSPGEVLINKDDALKFKVEVKDLKAYSATAVFPEQNLIDIDMAWDYDFGGAELTDLGIESGTLFMEVKSNVDEVVYVTYEAPGMIDPSKAAPFDTVIQSFRVPAASSGGKTRDTSIDLSGYNVILRGKSGEGWLEKNAFHNRLKAKINYTGVKKKISKDDSITLKIELRDIKPSFVKGYMGQDTFKVGPETQEFVAFQNLNGLLDIEDVSVSLNIDNSAGIDAELDIPSVVSQGKTSDVALTSSLLKQPISVDMASDINTPWTSTTLFNAGNSNVDQFIENFPLSFLYNLEVRTNPGGNNNNWEDFIASTSELKASVNIDIPMKLNPTNVVLRDTLSMELGQLASNLESTDGLLLNLVVDNGYPYSVDVDFILMDEEGMPFDTLFNGEHIALPGTIESNTDIVESPYTSVLNSQLNLDESMALANAKKVVLIAYLQSNSQRYYPIYDSYVIDLKLTADVAYKQSFD